MRRALYALYRGEEFVDVGTKEELARRRGVKPRTIECMATDSYKRSVKDAGRRVMAYRLEEDE